MNKNISVEEAVKILKPGDLLVQTKPVFKGESKFIIVVRISPRSITHCHINRDNITETGRLLNVNFFDVRKPYKQELTKEVIKQYKRTLMKLILKRII